MADKKSREELDKELMELLHPNPWTVADRAEEALEGPEYLMADHLFDVRGFADDPGDPGDFDYGPSEGWE